jgi:CO/xanthine dehydrogenase Mo-binding subunit
MLLEIFMTTRYFGERIKRNEDPRLLTGQGLYVDDVDLPNMLHVAFVRSPYAHAKINSIDVSQALQREGVVAVYTANDLGDYWKPGPLLFRRRLLRTSSSMRRRRFHLQRIRSSLRGSRL